MSGIKNEHANHSLYPMEFPSSPTSLPPTPPNSPTLTSKIADKGLEILSETAFKSEASSKTFQKKSVTFADEVGKPISFESLFKPTQTAGDLGMVTQLRNLITSDLFTNEQFEKLSLEKKLLDGRGYLLAFHEGSFLLGDFKQSIQEGAFVYFSGGKSADSTPGPIFAYIGEGHDQRREGIGAYCSLKEDKLSAEMILGEFHNDEPVKGQCETVPLSLEKFSYLKDSVTASKILKYFKQDPRGCFLALKDEKNTLFDAMKSQQAYSGLAQIQLTGGETYTGHIKEGSFHGLGVVTYENGSFEIGNFNRDYQEGRMFSYTLDSDGRKKFYIGEALNLKKQGKGVECVLEKSKASTSAHWKVTLAEFNQDTLLRKHEVINLAEKELNGLIQLDIACEFLACVYENPDDCLKMLKGEKPFAL